MLHLFEHVFGVAFVVEDIEVSFVAAFGLVLRQVHDLDVAGGNTARLLVLHGIGDALGAGIAEGVLPDTNGRGFRTAADAWHANDSHLFTQNSRQLFQQRIGTGHRAGKRFAHAHRQRSGCNFAFFDDIEVVIERRYFVDFGERDFHRFGECRHVRGGKLAEFILDEMQIFDEQIAAGLACRQQCGDFGACKRIDLAALGRVARLHFAAHFG